MAGGEMANASRKSEHEPAVEASRPDRPALKVIT